MMMTCAGRSEPERGPIGTNDSAVFRHALCTRIVQRIVR